MSKLGPGANFPQAISPSLLAVEEARLQSGLLKDVTWQQRLPNEKVHLVHCH